MKLVQKVKFASCVSNVPVVERYLLRLKNRYNIDDELFFNIKTAIVEAVSNAILHGNCNDLSKNVSLEIYKSDEQFRFVITDQGSGFNHITVPDPTHPDNLEKPGGRGVFIIKKLADMVNFCQEGSKVEIEFNI
jgi:serine/threonine-protein kinase RsbW